MEIAISPTAAVAQGWSEPPDWEAKLAGAATVDDRWNILMEAGDWLAGSEWFPQAADYYAQAEEVAKGFPTDDPRMARTLVRRSALGEGEPAEDRSRLEQALAIQERSLGQDHLEHIPELFHLHSYQLSSHTHLFHRLSFLILHQSVHHNHYLAHHRFH